MQKSEQSRRDLEVQLAASRSREEEINEGLNRAREQANNHEEYVAELRRTFDEDRANLERNLAAAREARKDDQVARAQSEAMAARLQDELKRMKEIDRSRREREDNARLQLSDQFTKLSEARALEEKLRGQTQELQLLLQKWETEYFGGYGRDEGDLEQYFLA